MCVRVCDGKIGKESEREREREGEKESIFFDCASHRQNTSKAECKARFKATEKHRRKGQFTPESYTPL